MEKRKKYWIILGITTAIATVTVSVILLMFWTSLSMEEKEIGNQIIFRILTYGGLAFIVNIALFSHLLDYIFKTFIDPLDKLAEETQIIATANANYKLKQGGVEEVAKLTHTISELADKYTSLKTDVQEIVQNSRTGLNEEKSRLATLMAQIPQGVVVCNLDGKILLYNHLAQMMFEDVKSGNAAAGESRYERIGLGRSIFAFLDIKPFAHALKYLQSRLDEGEESPAFNFITSRFGEQFIRINMASVVDRDGEANSFTGYVLTMTDITSQIQTESQRDVFLQSLTIGLQKELDLIQNSIHAIFDSEILTGDYLEKGKIIDASSRTILEQIDMVAVQHANRLQNPGENECILGDELLQVLRQNVEAKFGIKLEMESDEGLWLNINCHTVIRGVMYLIGQLKNHLDVSEIELELRRARENAVLTVHWHGDPVKVTTIEEWKECPLMIKAKGQGPVSLENMLVGRGGITKEKSSEDEALYVRFNLAVVKPESGQIVGPKKENRPIYYEFDLFDRSHQDSDLYRISLDKLTYVVFDTETTGLEPSKGDEIISIGGIRIVNGKSLQEETFEQLIDPRREIPVESINIHGISPEMVEGMPLINEVLPRFHKFVEGSVLVAHNAAFDMKFLKLKEAQAEVSFDQPVLDTLLLSDIVHSNQELHNLDEIAERMGVEIVGRHTALGDSIVTAEVFLKLLPLLEAKGIRTLGDAIEASRISKYSNIKF